MCERQREVVPFQPYYLSQFVRERETETPQADRCTHWPCCWRPWCARSSFVDIGASGGSSERGGDVAEDCAAASLHLAHLFFDADQEDAALAHLKDYLSCRVALGRDWCQGCQQRRSEDAPMLTCSGCRVARFCSADHQRGVASGGDLWTGRHKDIWNPRGRIWCELLGF